MALTLSRKRLLTVGLTILGSGLLLWGIWPSEAFVPSVRLPQGMSLSEALQSGKSGSPQGWTTNGVPDGQLNLKLGFFTCAQMLVARGRAQLYDILGQTLERAPSQPTVNHLLPRLSECSDVSGERYLLAKELIWQVGNPPPALAGSTFLGFVWGGTNQLRHDRDRITCIEDAILKNGVFGFQLNMLAGTVSGYFLTNRCVIVRDTKGLVKIVPVDHLRAYVDSGLITLPNAK